MLSRLHVEIWQLRLLTAQDETILWWAAWREKPPQEDVKFSFVLLYYLRMMLNIAT